MAMAATEDDCLRAVEECYQRALLEAGEGVFAQHLQIFCEVVRGYIVAPSPDESNYASKSWFEKYRRKRKCFHEQWKLRGGICSAGHVKECFQWKDRKDRPSFYENLASILEQTDDKDCVLSKLPEDDKRDLRCSWIMRWAKSGEHSNTILIGKLLENDPTLGSFHVSSSALGSIRLRHVFRVLKPGEIPGNDCNPQLTCQAGPATQPPADGKFARLALDHVLHGSKDDAQKVWISTTASLGVAQRFSGQLFSPVALIFIGDMSDGGVNCKVQNLTVQHYVHLLEEKLRSDGGEVLRSVDVERCRVVETRAKRSQEVLVYATVPPACVRILTPSTRGRPCRAWPFDCASDLGNGFVDLRSRLAGICQPRGAAGALLNKEIEQGELELVRAVGGSNDGLSLVRLGGRLLLLKRAKPNVEEDEMLSPAAMRAQLQACWVAHAIHVLVAGRPGHSAAPAGEGGAADGGGATPGVDLGCCLYEYEAFFTDFLDPDTEGSFTWREGAVSQVWPGSFLLFDWPADEDCEPSDRSSALLADCLLGIDSARAGATPSRRDPLLTPAQAGLVAHVRKLDYALGCLAIERSKRNDCFSQPESILELLKNGVKDVAGSEYWFALYELLYQKHVTTGSRVQQIRGIASLLDLQPFNAIQRCFTYASCMNDRLDWLQQVENKLSVDCRLRSRSLSSWRDGSESKLMEANSPSLSDSGRWSSTQHTLEHSVDELLACIDTVLEQACNRCTILFTEPLQVSGANDATFGESTVIGQKCAHSEYLKYQITSDKDLCGIFEISVDVGTFSSLIEACHNNNMVILHTHFNMERASGIEKQNNHLTLKLCLETDLRNCNEKWHNSKMHTVSLGCCRYQGEGQVHDSITVTGEYSTANLISHLYNSKIKMLVLLDSERQDDCQEDYPTPPCFQEISFFMVLLRGTEEGLGTFCTSLCKALVAGKTPEEAFAISKQAAGTISAVLLKPKDPTHQSALSFRKGKQNITTDHSEQSSALEKGLKICSCRYNECLSEIIQRIEKPYIQPRHLYFDFLSIHLDVFMLWDKGYERCVDILNVYGLPGDSTMSEVAEELAQYLKFRSQVVLVASETSLVTSSLSSRDLIFQLDESCSEIELYKQIVQNPRGESKGSLIIFDARRLKSEDLKRLFSFPSELLNYAYENCHRLVIFHSEETCCAETISCIHQPAARNKTDAPLQHSLSKHPQGSLDDVNVSCGLNEIHKNLSENGLKLSVEQLAGVLSHYHINATEQLQHIDCVNLIQYLLDRKMQYTVRTDYDWFSSSNILERCKNLRRLEIGDVDDECLDFLRSVIEILVKLTDDADCGYSQSAKFQILRPVALLPKCQRLHVANWCNKITMSWKPSLKTGIADQLLEQIFSMLRLDLQQAFLFLAMLPERVNLDGGFFDVDELSAMDHSIPNNNTDAQGKSETFWRRCWLSSLAFESSESGIFFRLGGRFPGHSSPEERLFQWLCESGLVLVPAKHEAGLGFYLETLVKMGLIISDGNSYLIPSTFRSFCNRMLRKYLSACCTNDVVWRRELDVVDRLMAILLQQVESTSNRTITLIKHVSIWTWAIERMRETVSGKCTYRFRKAARLMWIVRRSVRTFYETSETETSNSRQPHLKRERGEKDWRGQVDKWARDLAQSLTCPAAHDDDADLEKAKNLAAAAMCWHMQAHAILSQQPREALEICKKAKVAIEAALQASNSFNKRAWTWEVCKLEIYTLEGKIKSEGNLEDKKIAARGSSSMLEGIDILKNVISSIERLQDEIDGFGTTRLARAENVDGNRIRCAQPAGPAESTNKLREHLCALRMLRCEVLNNLGNTYRVRVKNPGEAVTYYRRAYEASDLKIDATDKVSGQEFEMSIRKTIFPNFVSHNLGLSLLESASKAPEADRRQRLLEAHDHLKRALEVRLKAVHSKSFVSVLRLVDTHRTLYNVLADLRAIANDGNKAPPAEMGEDQVALHVPEGTNWGRVQGSAFELQISDEGAYLLNVEDLHRDRLAILGLLRRCARTWEDHKKALRRLCEWMRLTGPFLVPVHPQMDRFKVELKWRKNVDTATLNPEFFRLLEADSIHEVASEVQLAAEMLRSLTGLRVSAGAPVELVLSVDPAVVSLCRLSDQCLNRDMNPADFAAACRCIGAMVHGGVTSAECGGGGGAEGRQWRARVERSLKNLVETGLAAATRLNDTKAGAVNSAPAVQGLFIAKPEMYVAQLMHLSRSDMPNFKADVLRLALASAAAWCLVDAGWQGAEMRAHAHHGNSQRDHSAGSTKGKARGKKGAQAGHDSSSRDAVDNASNGVDKAYRKLLLLWLAATSNRVKDLPQSVITDVLDGNLLQENPETGYLHLSCQAFAFVGPFRPIAAPPRVPIREGGEPDVYVHSRIFLASARLESLQLDFSRRYERSAAQPSELTSSSERSADVLAAVEVVREFYLAVLAPTDNNCKAPAIAFLPELLCSLFKSRKSGADLLKPTRLFSNMFDVKATEKLRADSILQHSTGCTSRLYEDELLVELLRADQALECIFATAEGGPTRPNVSSKFDCSYNSGSNWMAKLAACLNKEASNVSKRLRNCMARASAASNPLPEVDPQERAGDVDSHRLAALFCRLRQLTDKLVAADPSAAEQIRAALEQDFSLWSAFDSAKGTALSPSNSGTLARAGRIWADPREFLCQCLLIGAQRGSRALDAEYDELLAICLRSTVLRAAEDQSLAGSDVGTLCLLWWAGADLTSENHLVCEALREMDDMFALRPPATSALPSAAVRPGQEPDGCLDSLLAACTAAPGRLRARAADARLRVQALEIANQREELAELRARLQALEAHLFLSPKPDPKPKGI